MPSAIFGRKGPERGRQVRSVRMDSTASLLVCKIIDIVQFKQNVVHGDKQNVVHGEKYIFGEIISHCSKKVVSEKRLLYCPGKVVAFSVNNKLLYSEQM